MRAVLLLTLAFVLCLVAWVRTGLHALDEVWGLYHSAADEAYGQPGRAAGRTSDPDLSAAQVKHAAEYYAALMAHLAEHGPQPAAREGAAPAARDVRPWPAL